MKKIVKKIETLLTKTANIDDNLYTQRIIDRNNELRIFKSVNIRQKYSVSDFNMKICRYEMERWERKMFQRFDVERNTKNNLMKTQEILKMITNIEH